MVRLLVLSCLVGFSLVLPAVPGSGSVPAGSPERLLEAQPGDRLANGTVAVIVPPPGHGVWAEAVLADGRTEILGVRTEGDGSVVVFSWGASDQIGLGALPTSPPDCDDDARSTLPFRWTSTFNWRFNARSSPSGLRKLGVERALKRATRNITQARNACSMSSELAAAAAYQGRTRKGTQIGSDGTCRPTGNGRNGVNFGALAAQQLGVACIWFRGDGTATESDVRLNRDHGWAARIGDACRDRWSIEAVATHERGHTFGLGHVAELDHGNLTMSESINGPCQKSEARLGRGDVRGLRSIY